MGRLGTDLLARLHSVFSEDPARVLALRVRHASGLAWAVAGDTLTLTGGVSLTVDLSPVTLGELATTLGSAGCEIAFADSSLSGLSALVLMEGAGDQDQSNGDHIYGYTSPLWVLLHAFGRADEAARAAISQALAQLYLTTVTDDWVSLFGDLFATARYDNESARSYAARIVAEVSRRRGSNAAILANIERELGYLLTMREPYKEIFTLSRSALSGADKFQSRPEYQYHTIQPVASAPGVDWAAVLAMIERDLPAGTVVIPPQT